MSSAKLGQGLLLLGAAAVLGGLVLLPVFGAGTLKLSGVGAVAFVLGFIVLLAARL